MTRKFRRLTLLAVFSLAISTATLGAQKDQYLHIKVEDPAKSESVNVNIPLSLAEKILPTINSCNLHQGHVTISSSEMDAADLRAILDALRTAPDNEFVTVKEHGQDVRVAKLNGNLVVHVREASETGRNAEITVPLKVVDALFSTVKKDELDVAAALRALAEAGDTLLVSIQDATQHVRIWLDSRGSQE
jgi:hypothetical protein